MSRASPGDGMEPSAEPPLTSDDTDAARSALTGIRSTLDDLVTTVERHHERAAHREQVIDRLHEENQVLRRGELRALHEPVRAALYRLHDMVRRESARWAEAAAPPEPDPAQVASLLCAIADEVAEALARTGVERFIVKEGERFDPARHRPVGTEDVTDPDLDGMVVASRTDGFEQMGQGGTVVRRAEVVVGRAGRRTPSRTRG